MNSILSCQAITERTLIGRLIGDGLPLELPVHSRAIQVPIGEVEYHLRRADQTFGRRDHTLPVKEGLVKLDADAVHYSNTEVRNSQARGANSSISPGSARTTCAY